MNNNFDFNYKCDYDEKGDYIENTGLCPIEVAYVSYLSTFPSHSSLVLNSGEKIWFTSSEELISVSRLI